VKERRIEPWYCYLSSGTGRCREEPGRRFSKNKKKGHSELRSTVRYRDSGRGGKRKGKRTGHEEKMNFLIMERQRARRVYGSVLGSEGKKMEDFHPAD